MAAIGVYLNTDCWPEIAEKKKLELKDGSSRSIQFALNHGSLSGGKSAVIVRIDLPDDSVVLAEIGLEQLWDAVRLLVNSDRMVKNRSKR